MPELKVSSCQDKKQECGWQEREGAKPRGARPDHNNVIIVRGKVMADHFMPGMGLSVLHGLFLLTLTITL